MRLRYVKKNGVTLVYINCLFQLTNRYHVVFVFFAVGGSEKTINYRIVLVAAKVTAEPLLALAVPEEI